MLGMLNLRHVRLLAAQVQEQLEHGGRGLPVPSFQPPVTAHIIAPAGRCPFAGGHGILASQRSDYQVISAEDQVCSTNRHKFIRAVFQNIMCTVDFGRAKLI